MASRLARSFLRIEIMNIGLAIRIAREQRGISAKELADRASLSPSAISLIENGEGRNLLFSTACAIARALDIPLSGLQLLAENAEAIQERIENEKRKVDELRSDLINDLIVAALRLQKEYEDAPVKDLKRSKKLRLAS
jgi:transcriptional regulator with XRE-family HTH domain